MCREHSYVGKLVSGFYLCLSFHFMTKKRVTFVIFCDVFLQSSIFFNNMKKFPSKWVLASDVDILQHVSGIISEISMLNIYK